MATKDIRKDVRYLGKDFISFRNNLIDFSRTYFPKEYNDFSDASIGMMFIEMSSYVGDVLSFYIDNQLRENFLQYAKNRNNIVNLAQDKGYKPRVAGISYTNLDVFQIIPATSYPFKPDWRYAIKVSDLKASPENNTNISFRVNDIIDFSESGSSPTDVTVYETNESGETVTFYLLKKNVKASSGIIVEKTFTIGNPEKYLKIILPDTDVVEILSVTDSDGNAWYEVPYLAHDTILDSIPTELISEFTDFKYTVPYLLRYKRVSKRFVTRVRSDNKIELQFGAGSTAYPDEILIPNPNNVSYDYFNKPLDPRNFLNTRTYGQVPGNTVLTIKYLKGTSEESNVAANEINTITEASITNNESGLDQALFNRVKNSLAVINRIPAVGARSAETNEEIKDNARAYFSAQDRCVTFSDYEIRILSMNPKFGNIAKVKVVQDDQLIAFSRTIISNKNANPFALSAYCLSYDANKKLTQLNNAIKNNLKNYLDSYRMATDAINIKDAYIINIGIEFDIVTYSNVLNKREVVLRCVDLLKTYFDIDKWQIGQPIFLTEIYNILDNVEGVRTVSTVRIENKYDTTGITYSTNLYDINTATIDDIVYPSLDPSCWEIKYPDLDIKGRAR